ncbi:hypothetical protein [Maridesulfovibrio ferrireducens]|uniref:hypothetical protein n=1 Tax=Maridesulfovibrio ferrireducens TaxID=246191 RepID=UPI001A1B0C92|nr:hypothetical protein [Maridesulfovibrio ferrireducens]MBI9113144.1 hypothetical protein [Maridesulfovibrio ferrireducens]
MKLSGGDIEFYKWFDNDHRKYKSLKRLEAGTANNGQWTEIEGYWEEEPIILLSPNTIVSSKSAVFSNQILSMGVGAIEEFSPNRYRFMPNALLVLQPGVQTVSIGLHGEGVSSAETSDYVTLDFCSAVSAKFSVSSIEETDTLNKYYHRVVQVDLYVDGAVAGSTEVYVGPTLEPVLATVMSGVISAGAHTIKLVASSSRGIGTFVAVQEIETVSTMMNCPVVEESRVIALSAGFTSSRSYETTTEHITLLTPGMPAGGSWKVKAVNIRASYQCSASYVGAGVVTLKGEAGGVSDSLTWSGLGRSYELLVSLDALPSSMTFDVTGIAETDPPTVLIGNEASLYAALNFCIITVVWGRNTSSGGESTAIDLQQLSLTTSGVNNLAEGTVNYLAAGN